MKIPVFSKQNNSQKMLNVSIFDGVSVIFRPLRSSSETFLWPLDVKRIKFHTVLKEFIVSHL